MSFFELPFYHEVFFNKNNITKLSVDNAFPEKIIETVATGCQVLPLKSFYSY